jgi:hypothetical protein
MKKKAPEQPAGLNRIWFMGFPDVKTLVLTGLILWAAYDMGMLPC